MSAFIRVIPDEVLRFGPAAAIVLAHIRFRCESDGPDRVVHEGARWWQVSRRDIGTETGLSSRAIGIALEKLGEHVAAKYLAAEGGRPWAYRVKDDVASRNTFAQGDVTSRNTFTAPPLRKRHDPPTKTQSSPISSEVEEGGRSAPPTSSAQSANGKAAKWVRGPFGPRCTDHIDVEFPPACGGCGSAREAAKREDDQAVTDARAARAAITRAIDDCADCDAYGRLHDLSDCPRHPNHRQQAAS